MIHAYKIKINAYLKRSPKAGGIPSTSDSIPIATSKMKQITFIPEIRPTGSPVSHSDAQYSNVI